MKTKVAAFLLMLVSFFTYAQEVPKVITVDNQTDTSIYAVVYCDPIIFGSTATREYDPVEVGAHSQEPVSRPGKTAMCNRYLVCADSAEQLKNQLTKEQFKQLASIGVGTTTLGRLFDYFYVLKKDDKLKAYNPFSYLGSGKINSLEEFAQTQAARLVMKDSVLVQKNPFKDTQATVRVGAQLCPDEVLYVKKRKSAVKIALEKLTGKKLSGTYVPTIAAINSGGGTRAMTCMLGFHVGLQNIGLLDVLTYDVGLSGGSWFVSLWMNSKKSIYNFKQELRKLVQLGSSFIVESKSRKLTKDERALFADALLVRAALKQPVTLVNFWGALLATRYLEPYGKNRQAVRFSQVLSGDYAQQYPFPILTAVSAYGYDDTHENRIRMNWYEFTPYEVGGVGNWLGNSFVPTWAFGRKFSNKISQNNNPEYDLGLLMGIWGSAFAVTYARVYEELLPQLDTLKAPVQLLREKLDDSWVTFQKKHVSVAKAHNFTRDMPSAPYKDKHKLLLADAGIAFNLPYPPVSGHGARKADILVFFDASDGLESGGAQSLQLSENYAQKYGLKFPQLPRGQDFVDATMKAFAIFKDESDPEVPLVIYLSRIIDRNAIKYDASIPKEYKTNTNLLKIQYTATEFDLLSLATQQNIEQSIDQIREAISWKIAQRGGFVEHSVAMQETTAGA